MSTASRGSILSQRYQELFLSQKYVDCSFRIDQTMIKCHKLILSAASPVFEAMFYGPMSEEKCIEILDVSPEVFQLMVSYIYTNELNYEKESIENIIELYYCAEKYLLTDLLRLCLSIIKVKLRYHNILSAMDLSVYMGLTPLIQICMNFFGKFCLNVRLYSETFESFYYHISKECLKAIIQGMFNSQDSIFLPWFVQEWCKFECKNLGMDENKYEIILNDLDIPELKQLKSNQSNESLRKFPHSYFIPGNYVERVYYKASRPFIISDTCSEFSVSLKTNQLISLCAIVINSRLFPKIISEQHHYDYRLTEYKETFDIEIVSNNQIIHKQRFLDSKINYNCDINIPLDKFVILSPETEYCVKFVWGSDAFGAEYPCNLQSNHAGEIIFIDNSNYINDGGSILKGVKYLNLV